MQKVIAKIRLNPGHGGFFDPITRIHLTHGEPEASVLAGMNTTALKAAVRNKRISLVSGSLGEYTPPFKLVRNANGKIAIIANTPKEEKQEKPVRKDIKSVSATEKKPPAITPQEEKKEEPSQTAVETVRTAPELPAVNMTVKDVHKDIPENTDIPMTDNSNPFEDISVESPEESSKKKKKKKGNDGDK